MSRKAVFDTSVYIRAMRAGSDSPEYQMLLDLAPITYLCSVVSAELYAGAMDSVAVRTVDRVVSRFGAVGRILVPTNISWNQSGKLLGVIRRKEAGLQSKLPGLFNDALIAMASLQVGATLYTTNARDFQLIQRYKTFDLNILKD